MVDIAEEPVSLEQAKLNLRVDSAEEDADIADMIGAAREKAEKYTGLILTARSIVETAPRLDDMIELSAWPVTSIDAIRYTAVDGTMVELPAGSWRAMLARRPVRIYPMVSNWGLPLECRPRWTYQPGQVAGELPVEIEITAGYASPADVPIAARRAILLLVTHFYTNRSAVESGVRAAAVAVPLSFETLLDDLRLERV